MKQGQPSVSEARRLEKCWEGLDPSAGRIQCVSQKGREEAGWTRPTRTLVTCRAAAALSVLIGCVVAQSHPPSGSGRFATDIPIAAGSQFSTFSAQP
jgi:hypothetical protein